MQLEMFEELPESKIKLEDLFQAYFDCRVHKRNTGSALKFEADYESQLVRLWEEINDGTYKIGQSVAFIVHKPVQREIFAANFRDRIVHHLVINKINDLIEQCFIDDSYSCRKGKGSLYGVHKIRDYIRECSENYTKDCYILKMDVQAFFMSIDKDILCRNLLKMLKARYHAPDRDIIFNLVRMIIYNAPQNGCIIKGSKRNWDGLPAGKSLFGCKKNKGMPIGNLTSQIFANFYMSGLDTYITQECGVRYYGRYVDDFVLIHRDKAFLQEMKLKIEKYLQNKLHLHLHPKKFYLQHYSKGVKFIGSVIKPHREYIANRTKGNFCAKVRMYNAMEEEVRKNPEAYTDNFMASINSYLGFMKHYKTYRIRKSVLEKLSDFWRTVYYSYNTYQKVVVKQKYKSNVVNLKNYRAVKKKDFEDFPPL